MYTHLSILHILKLRTYQFYHKEHEKISHKLEVDTCNIHYFK